MSYSFWKLFSFLCSWTPYYFLDASASFIARAYFNFSSRRWIILANIKQAYPLKSLEYLETLGVASLKSLITTIFEFLALGEEMGSQVEFTGREYLDDALKKGNGVYILCGHLGNWEAMGAAMTRKIVKSHVLVKKIGGRGLHQFITGTRERSGFHVIFKKKKGDAFAQIKNILGCGEVVGFVMDQARPGCERLPFFGRLAQTNTSFGAIWQKAPAPIVPAYAVRQGFGKHTVVFLEELEFSQHVSIEEFSRRCNEVLEGMILSRPEEYLWLHNRFKFSVTEARSLTMDKQT